MSSLYVEGSERHAAAAPLSGELALSFPQFGMWFQQQQAPTSSVCTVGFALRASGPLQVGAMHHAVQALMDRHAVLRTTYHLRGGSVVQRIAAAATAPLEVRPCAASGADGSAAQIAIEISRPFDLETGPVFRAVLFTDGAARHTVLVTFHHIAADGWSSHILISEMQSLYEAAAANRPSGLPRPAASYDEFVRWQAAELEGAGGERQWSYWRRVLAAPRQRSVLPTDIVRPAVPRFVGSAISADLSADLVQRVKALAARLRTTPFVVLLGGFQLLMARLCGVRDVTTGMPVLGRPNAAYMSIVGNFINVLPVRSWIEETASVGEFLTQLRATVVGALQMQHFPLARMVQRLNLSGEETGQALFNTSFSLLAPDDAGVVSRRCVAGTTFELLPLALQAGMLDLAVDIIVSGDDGMHCFLKYSLDVLTEESAAAVARQYVAMLDAMTEAPHQLLSGLLGPSLGAVSDDARAATLLGALAARDITLTIDGERLRVNAPKGALDEAARQAIAAQRPAILARLKAAAALDAAVDFWRMQLEAAPMALAFPTDRPRTDPPAGQRPRFAVLGREVPSAVLGRLRSVGEAHGAGLFVTLLATWQVLLHRYCGQDEIVVATSGATGLAGVIPVCGRLAGNPAFDRFLEQIRMTLLAAGQHGMPPARPFQARFDVRLTSGETQVDAEVRAGAGVHDEALELALEITTPAEPGERGPAQFRYRFAADLFDTDTIERLHENFCTLMASVAADPIASVLDLELLGAMERRRYSRDSGVEAEVSDDRGRCLHQLLEESVRLHPGRIAVGGAGDALRYDALDAQANRLAHFLLEAGLRVGSVVAVCLERTVNLPVALAAVLKAGGAYVPLDPTHPRERLRGIVRESAAVCLITQHGFEDIAAEAVAHVVRLDADAAAIGAGSAAPPRVAVRPDDLAYVIYTSGSTGRPKGVEVEHRNVVAFLEAMRRQPGLSAGDVLLAVTTVAFDIAGLEIWLPLSVGARIVLATRAEAVDGVCLAELLDAQAVSVMQATPATWRLMLESGWCGRPTLRALCGGEALSPMLAARLVGHVGELWNMYGPTETTIWSTAARVTLASLTEGTALVPIGRPIANTVVRVEDRSGRVVPAGVAGELLIGGAGVARGYRGRPDLTAPAFVTRNIGTVTSRLYRTGDLARFRGDGQLDFLGRRDHQIKLRGHRIEPGEIELRLTGHPGVTSCVVIARAVAPGDERLVAYLTLAAGALLDVDALRSTLRGQLPDYMVPGHFVVLPMMPLTPNGKLDRKALPPPETVGEEADTAAATPGPSVLMTPVQQRVAMLWKEVLGVARVGLNDNFFDIGGHSLLLVKMHAGLKREFACDLALVELFQHTTVAQQARAVERSAHA